MNFFHNLDLLSVGIVTATIGMLGFVVFFNNRRSVTNRTFLAFALLTIFYGTFNYLNYQADSPLLILWLLRITIFFAVWHAFSFCHLFVVFPKDTVELPRWYKIFLIPLVATTSLLTLTPFVFSGIEQAAKEGVTNPERGPAIALFGMVVVFLVAYGIVVLFRKTKKAVGLEKIQFRFISVGTFLTFSLIIVFNFILPVIFNNLRFVPLAPVFIFPFIITTTYSIVKHRLLDVKVVATEILTFLLAVVTFAEIIFSENPVQLAFRIVVFFLVLFFGILLIRSVLREIEQRQKLEKLTAELQGANDKLREMDRLKSEFLSFASHQVKAPMTVVKGYASLIADGTYGVVPEKAKESATKIVQSVDRLIALVNNLLDLRKLEQGKMNYSFEPIVINEIVQSVFDELKPLADKKGLVFTYENLAPDARANLDRQKFRQVVQNLVDNSIKYTEKGWVKVTLALKEDKSRAVMTISDSGRGMPKELLAHLFEQFTRGSEAAKSIQGTGLGLFIAKQMILAHKGDIFASSEGEGKGSVFTVETPVV